MNKPGKMLREVLSHLFKKPATQQYPAVKPPVPDKLRGQLEFSPERCIGCKLCMRDCPAEAITIVKVGEKKFEATFDLDRCIYCGQCADSCNKGALKVTTHYELAQLDRSKLKITFQVAEDDSGTTTAAAAKLEESGD